MPTTAKPRVANPIADRRLSVAGAPGREIVITVGKPRPAPEPETWACSYLVEGLPNVRRRVAYGGDSLQALQMAIEGARQVLLSSGLVLVWDGGEPGEIGLPRSIPTFEGSGFREKIEQYIERELKKFLRMAKARSDAKGKAR